MKLKLPIPKLIHFQKYNAIFLFLMAMAAFTIISRAADSFMIPQVSVSSPEEMSLKYPLEIQGSITAKENYAVYCQENLRISQVKVQENDMIKKGDLLFSIDKNNLQTVTQQTEQEIQKLDLQIKNLEQAWHNQASQQELALSRAQEDYTDVANTSQSDVNAAYLEWENAKNELHLHRIQKPTLVELESENDQNESTLHDTKKPDVSETTNDPQPPTEDPMDAWTKKQSELEQLCQEKQKQYEDALAAQDDSLKTAARQIEDARQPLTKDNSAALLQIEKANLSRTLEALKELSQAEGNVYSEYDGQVLECPISTGSMTSQEPVMILADFAQSFQFEGTFTPMEGQSMEAGTEGTLKMQEEPGLLEHIKISSVSQKENEAFHITADLDSYEISKAQEAVLDITRESKIYPCCIPLSALYSRESGDFVIRIQEKSTILGIQTTAEYVPVTVLEKNDQYAAVEGNLSSSDFIIVNASKTIKDGDRIRVLED
ncbi:hypothetical protein C806_00144 [Lachnospiraceae bacterium 3-1]|nr:hypothetical protein C806_00144 [Lachnospiraceae bacterium 3-1]